MKYNPSPGAGSGGSVDVSGETARAEAAEAGLQDNIDAEAAARAAADDDLQAQIDAVGPGGTASVEVLDDGNDVGPAVSVDFGTGLSVTYDDVGDVARVDVIPNAGSGLVQDMLSNPDWVQAVSVRAAVQADVGQTTVGRFWREDRARIPFTAGARPRGGLLLSLAQRATDFTKTGAGTLGESTTYPLTYDRSVTLTCTGASLSTIRPTAASSPFNLTRGMMRAVLRPNNAWGAGAGPIYLQVASDNFVSGNYHQVLITRANEQLLAIDRWGTLSVNFNEFAPVGLGADLSSVNQWRIASSGGLVLTIGLVEFVPAVMPRALAVVGVDDSTGEMWNDMVRTMASYGLPPTLYVNIGGLDASVAGVGNLKYQHLRMAHDFLGAQIATHAFYTDHNEAHFGDDLHGYHMRAMALRKALGFYGHEDASYYGGPNIGMHFITDDHYKLVRKLYATCRGNFNHLATVETLPLADPWNTRSYLLGSDDTMDAGSELRTYIDKGIEGKGYIEISSHNSNWSTLGPAQGVPICQYLAQKQADGLVDVVTKAEAMRRLALVAA